VVVGTVTNAGMLYWGQNIGANFGTMWRFGAPMRAAPNVVFYSTLDGSSGNASTSGVNYVVTPIGLGLSGVAFSAAAVPFAANLSVHATANAEL
jgi:hypothetical protein